MGEIIVELGHHSINIIFKDKKINLKIYPLELRHRAIREYEVLRKLYKHGINVPQPIKLVDSANCMILIREFVDGIFFRDAIERLSIDELRVLLLELIKQLNAVENLGIYISEFSSLSKNVIVVGTKPYLIDVERASFQRKSIVTQLLGFLIKLSGSPKLCKKLSKVVQVKKLKAAAQIYKKTRNLDTILDLFRA